MKFLIKSGDITKECHFDLFRDALRSQLKIEREKLNNALISASGTKFDVKELVKKLESINENIEHLEACLELTQIMIHPDDIPF